MEYSNVLDSPHFTFQLEYVRHVNGHCCGVNSNMRTEFVGHTDVITCFCLWENSVYSGSRDFSILRWEWDGKCSQKLLGHSLWIQTLVVHDNFLFSGSLDRSVRKWDFAGNCVGIFEFHKLGVVAMVSFNGFLFSGSNDVTIQRWESCGKTELYKRVIPKCFLIWKDRFVCGCSDR